MTKSIQELMAEMKANQANQLTNLPMKLPETTNPVKDIILNVEQTEAHDLALEGESFCLIGAAGTGKTTSIKKISRSLIDKGHIPLMTLGTRYLKVGLPGIVVMSYTRKAVNNIRKNVVDELKSHTVTIHKLLEFAPVKYDIIDPQTGKYKTTMKFEPQRNRYNPLPTDLKVVIWEEASMIGTPLYNMFREACHHDVQEIFLGDIQQLPPIFGSAVLGFKMLELKVIELTEVYRQALLSPIIKLAWDILSGDGYKFKSSIIRDTKTGRISVPCLDAYNANTEHGNVKIQYWQTSVNETKALRATLMLFKNWYEEGYYDPNQDIILCPFNKGFGSTEINKYLSQHFSKLRNEPVYEIIAGFNRVYWAVGDRVLYDKEDAFIESIEPNPSYLGKSNFSTPSVYLDRWGMMQEGPTEEETIHDLNAREEASEKQVDYFLESNTSLEEIDDRVNAASHIVTVRIAFSNELVKLKDARELHPESGLIGGYCISIHKSQGSEWEKVFVWLHHSHIKMCQRELLYTAITRARNSLHIMCETTTLEKGVKSQKIRGNTIQEKALVFEGKLTGADNEIPKKSNNLDITDILSKLQQEGTQHATEETPPQLLEQPQSKTLVAITADPKSRLAEMKARLFKMKQR